MQYFADTNGAAVRASLGEEVNSIISMTGFSKLLSEEVASCLVSSRPTQFFSLPQFTAL